MILGIGIDMEDVERMRLVIDRHGQRFLDKIYTPREIAYVEDKANRYERYAARFAAKEATIKALGRTDIAFQDVEVIRSPGGRPTLRLLGRAAEHAAGLGVVELALSLSHCREYAVAMVVLHQEAGLAQA